MDLASKQLQRGTIGRGGVGHWSGKLLSHMRAIGRRIRWSQLLVIYLAFVSVIHYFERIKPRWVLSRCGWSKWEKWPKGAAPHHSLIYGDPQIIDDYSYTFLSRFSLWVYQWVTDNYLHRNHQLLHSVLDPHSVLFIGDLFDGGRVWDNNEWYSEYFRFNNIFNPQLGVRQYRQIPGNHDVGFGMGVNFERYSRFKTYFGNADDWFVLGNHSVILLDTVSLSCNNDTRVRLASEQFLNSLQDPNHPSKQLPRIVLTHVPLYRMTEKQMCGKYRESSKPFPVVRGNQYQTVLEFEMSQKILHYIEPSIVFSGDDHDYCAIKHPLTNFMGTDIDYETMEAGKPGIDYANEITVKSSAMTGGIKRPAVQLISAWNPTDELSSGWNLPPKETTVVDAMTVKSELCYLPSPTQPIIHYAIYLALALLWVFVCTVPVKYGAALNLRFNHWLKKTAQVIRRVTKAEHDVSLGSMEPKKQDRLIKLANFFFLNWNVLQHADWADFVINGVLVVVGFLGILLTYFISI